MLSAKKRAYYYGKYSEWLACLWLILKGYRFIKHDYLTKYGQVDLIFYKKNVLIFVEVKSRKKMAIIENLITHQQKRHLLNAARYFISKNNYFSEKVLRFDAVYVIGFFRILHFKNIYDDI